jgi:hypothetical protein
MILKIYRSSIRGCSRKSSLVVMVVEISSWDGMVYVNTWAQIAVVQ